MIKHSGPPKSDLKKLLLLAISISISACSSLPSIQNNYPHKAPNSLPTPVGVPSAQSNGQYLCKNAHIFANKVVGNGHCVSLIKQCTDSPNTRHWLAGKKVLSLPPGSIPYGTVIATFKNGKYPSVTGYHAAIYISHNEQGIWVWDQWVGKPVHKRLIRVRNDKTTASNTAQAYSIVN